MLPSRTKLALAIAWILFWILMISTAVQDYLRDGGQQVWQPILWEGSSGVVSTLLMLMQRRSTRRYDHLLPSPRRWFARQLPWLGVFWVAFVPLAFGLRHGGYALMGDTYTHPPWPQTFFYEDMKITIFFSIFVAIVFGVLSYHALLDEKLRAERANASLRQTQLLQLTQQMQPHFLFNALNTISSLMHSDVERADAMLIQLADVLRATLDAGDRHQVPLEMELRLLRGYATLMAERFDDRVRIEWRIDDALLACQVPVMSMQPLLENIFKHTVEQRRQPTAITISAASEAGHGAQQDRAAATLVLRLEDDAGMLPAGQAAPQQAGGIGTRNLRERLAALYGSAATFELIQLQPAGVRAEIRLPCAS
jgi:two-component system LytT family sensor kinase